MKNLLKLRNKTIEKPIYQKWERVYKGLLTPVHVTTIDTNWTGFPDDWPREYGFCKEKHPEHIVTRGYGEGKNNYCATCKQSWPYKEPEIIDLTKEEEEGFKQCPHQIFLALLRNKGSNQLKLIKQERLSIPEFARNENDVYPRDETWTEMPRMPYMGPN